MKLFFAFLLGLCSVVAFARPDRNAFLNQRATSVAQLIEQVRRDPEVMDRYRRHFAMSNREVMAYFSGLRLARLTAAGAYNVYSVPPGGLIKVHVQKLRLGTPVFADAFGNPIMILKCGNPLTRGPNAPEASIEPDPVLIARKTEELRDLETQTDEMIGLEELQAMTPGDVARPADLPEEIITTNESPIPILPAGGPIGGWILGLLGGGLIIGGGGGGSDDFNETIVPEPATLGVMLVAGAGLALRRRTTRKGR